MSDGARRRGRPTKANEEAITPSILDHATAEFFRLGYNEANVAVVAKLAGCSKRTLYARFASKADLFRACLEHFVEKRLRGIQMNLRASDSLEKQLVAAATALCSYVQEKETYNLHRLQVEDNQRFPEMIEIMEHAAVRPALKLITDILRIHSGHCSDARLQFLGKQFLAITALRQLHGVLQPSLLVEDVEETVKFFIRGAGLVEVK